MIEPADRRRKVSQDVAKSYREAGLRVRFVKSWLSRTQIRERCEHVTRKSFIVTEEQTKSGYLGV